MEKTFSTSIPHAQHGSPDCAGCLIVLEGAPCEFCITCDKCWAVIQTGADRDLARTLAELELLGDLAMAECPFCKRINLFPGIKRVDAFVCKYCGKDVVSRKGE